MFSCPSVVPLALSGPVGGKVGGPRVAAAVLALPAFLATLADTLRLEERRESAVSLALVPALRALPTKPGTRRTLLALTFAGAALLALASAAAFAALAFGAPRRRLRWHMGALRGVVRAGAALEPSGPGT